MSQSTGPCPKCGKPRVRQSWCREHYNEYMREYLKKRYTRRRAQLLDSRGNQCAGCGIFADDASVRLEVDHIDPMEKRLNLSMLLSTGSMARVWVEFEKCQLLCSRCHKHKTAEQRHIDRSTRPPLEDYVAQKRLRERA